MSRDNDRKDRNAPPVPTPQRPQRIGTPELGNERALIARVQAHDIPDGWRYREYQPSDCEAAVRFAYTYPGLSQAHLALSLGTTTRRLIVWANQYPEFRQALDFMLTSGEAYAWDRINASLCDPNAMFILKAVHGYTDRPLPTPATAGGSIDITIRVLGADKENPSYDVELARLTGATEA